MNLLKLKLLLIYFISFGSMAQNFDIQGHRGCRGLMPENSIEAFEKALELGVTTLELDVVISKDHQVVVSHEPYFNPDICLGPEGKEISPEQSKSFNIYQLEYAEVKNYDCGSKEYDRFPSQKKIKTYKPLLSQVIKLADEYCEKNNLRSVNFNIEIKSQEEEYGVSQPNPKEFSDLVYQVIKDLPVTRITIQSFDHQILQYWKISYPQFTLALLEENISSPTKAIKELGFNPHIYSPDFKLLNKKKIIELFDMGVKVIPWTVNEKDDMKKLVKWGVDGLITDYPDRFKEVFPDKMNQ